MPDFDTQRPQEPNEPNRLRVGMMATKHRILLVANRLRSRLLANRFVSLLGIVNFLGVVATVALFFFLFPETVTCDQWKLEGKRHVCHAPEQGDTVEVCKANSRDEVDGDTPCREPYSPIYCSEGTCYDSLETCRTWGGSGGSGDDEPVRCRRANFLVQLRAVIDLVIWIASP
jgi:hypothetical protein